MSEDWAGQDLLGKGRVGEGAKAQSLWCEMDSNRIGRKWTESDEKEGLRLFNNLEAARMGLVCLWFDRSKAFTQVADIG